MSLNLRFHSQNCAVNSLPGLYNIWNLSLMSVAYGKVKHIMTSNIEPSNIEHSTYWNDKCVIVTGGAGFLGSFVIEKLKQRGATDVFIPRTQNYNLIDTNDIRRMYANTLKNVDPKNVIIIHLAANV